MLIEGSVCGITDDDPLSLWSVSQPASQPVDWNASFSARVKRLMAVELGEENSVGQWRLMGRD